MKSFINKCASLREFRAKVKNWPMLFLNYFIAVVYRLRGGFVIRVRPEDRCAFHDVFIARHYDVDIPWNTFRRIIDIGANIGAFTVFAAQRMHREGKILSLEPDSENSLQLIINVVRNNLRAETIHAAIAGDDIPRALHAASPGEHNFYRSHGKTKTTVRCMTLEQLLDGKPCDLLKMDCEGAEYESIYALPAHMWPLVRFLLIEYHHFVPGQQPARLREYLEQQGFMVSVPRKSFFLAQRK